MRQLKYKRMFFYEDLFVKYGKKLLRLESMDYDTKFFKMPKIYKRAIDLMFKHHTLTYSDFGGIRRFKQLVLDYEKNITGISSDKSEVFVGSGVSSIIFPTIEAVLNLPENKNRREVILFSPDYTIFHSSVEYAGGIPKLIYSKRENNYQVTIDQISENITENTAAILFSNPNNPTCQIYSENWTKDLLAISKESNLFIISDEIYFDTVYKDYCFSHIPHIQGSYQNYAKLYGLSKDMPGMTGMRTGYYIGDRRLIEHLSNSQLVRNFSGNINADFIFLVDIALRYYARTGIKFEDLKWFSNEEIDNYYYTVDTNKKLQQVSNSEVCNALIDNDNVVDVIHPNCGNSVYFRYYKTLSPDEMILEFIKKGLAIYPCDVFGMNPEEEGSWSRICVTKDINLLKQGIAKI